MRPWIGLITRGRLTSSGRSYRQLALGLVAAVVVGGCGPDDFEGATLPADALVVGDEVIARALGNVRPARLTMTEEIEHFTARLQTRGGADRLSRQRLVAAHLLRFRAYGNSEDLAEAQGHLAALETANRPAPELLSLRSSIQLLEHDFSGALRAAREANRLSGDFVSGLRLRLFDALWAAGEYALAENLLDLPHNRSAFDYLVREARVLDRRGHTEKARNNLAHALKQVRAYAEPAAVVAWTLTELGHFENHSGRPEVAVLRYLESLDTLPGNPAALEGLAQLAAGVDRNFEAATLLFARALRNGAHLDLYLDFADAAAALAEDHKAALARTRFIERATVTPEVEGQYLRPLALLLADHYPDRLAEALRYAQQDLEQRPTSESWDTVAWVQYRMGDLETAFPDSRKATGWGVPEPSVLYHAGVIADSAGERERALGLLEAALNASTELTLEQVEEIERRLGS